MNELIENTLHIISKISQSSKGYILQLDENSYKVLKIWGGKIADFELLNDVLFNVYITDGINSDNVADLSSLKQLLKKIPAADLFINELITYSKKSGYYILLFLMKSRTYLIEDKIVSILHPESSG
jgi:hypothetical protein